MRLLALVLFGFPLAVATIVEARRGNPFAIGVALGLIGPTVYFATVALLARPKPLPRKADPAKIARLERELAIGPQPSDRVRAHAATMAEWDAVTTGPQEGTTAWEGDRLLVYRHGHWVPAQANVVDTEAPTTPFEQPISPTFHGAPTFGHKIEGP